MFLIYNMLNVRVSLTIKNGDPYLDRNLSISNGYHIDNPVNLTKEDMVEFIRKCTIGTIVNKQSVFVDLVGVENSEAAMLLTANLGEEISEKVKSDIDTSFDSILNSLYHGAFNNRDPHSSYQVELKKEVEMDDLFKFNVKIVIATSTNANGGITHA